MHIDNPEIRQIISKYIDIWSLNYMLKLASWDTETYMPLAGVNAKSVAASRIETMLQQKYLDPNFRDLVKQVQSVTNLNEYEQAIVRVLTKYLDNYTKLPPEFVEKLSLTVNKATTIWSEAKQTNNYQLFAPVLQEIISLMLQKADYLGYEGHPYNALLKLYEDDWDVASLDKYFAEVKATLAKFDLTKADKNVNPESISYDVVKMKALSYKILKFFNYDPTKLRLDESAHPFTNFSAVDDVRITTKFTGNNISTSLYSTIHEYGHALYGLQSDPEFEFTPLADDVSYALHESQSRFWENHIGRNPKFIEVFYKDIIETSPQLKAYSLDQLVKLLNVVKPSLIRTEADELTYHYHILIRYEIEKGLMDKTYSSADAPAIWNAKYKEYLGVEPTDYAHGILQDIHWSFGLYGYFPSYSIGTALASTWEAAIIKDLGDFDKLITTSQGLAKIQNWLKTNMHKYYGIYEFKQLVKLATGEEFSLKPWYDHLAKKFPELLKNA